MWILDILPEFVVHLLFVVGILGVVAGFVLGFIPVIDKYKSPIQIISIIIIIASVYIEGGMAERYKQKVEIAELKEKLAKAEAAASKVNTEIVTKILTKKQIVKEKGDTVIEYIDREVAKADNTCIVPESAIKALNAAALNKSVDEVIDTSELNQAATNTMKVPKK